MFASRGSTEESDLHPIPWVLVAAAGIVFAGTWAWVAAVDGSPWAGWVAERAADRPLDALERSSLTLTTATAPVGTAVVATAAAALLLVTRRLSGIALLAAGVGGAGLAVLGVRLITDVARPLADPLGPAAGSGFPSAHAASWAALATVIWCLARGARARLAWSILGGLLVLAIAASRVHLGAHGPLDVAAGIALGVVTVGVASTTIGRWDPRIARLRRSSPPLPRLVSGGSR